MAGQNFWNTNYKNWDASPSGLPFWSKVETSSVTLVRVGGNAYNNASKQTDSRPSDPLGYVKIVDEIRSNCKTCEPVITIPFDFVYNNNVPKNYQQQFDEAVANSVKIGTKILHLLNIVHKRNIRYIIIANEPGVDYGWPKNDTTQQIQYAKNIKAYFEPMAKALKEVDPDIKIIGPSCENYIKKVYNELFPNNGICSNSIAGLIQDGRAKDKPLVD